ncbi:hypothetical protein SAZ10_00530 [Mesorhizobium sp. BAC0120]|uniref:hypothetical protein n=1 Tax=Mesorhizobium sp. BAC0120 TaxID=3090670 RepID=UPI00298CF52C|nr:hypothetical protein [Mesorhizobium sp. BAC0120]MDW6020241.1 hypothetical protein [Mesorhizobium sp. BAC0120]
MARSKAMGYAEEPFFRGERTGIFPDEYREAAYFSRDPEYAGKFAKLGGHEEPREFRLKMGNTFDFYAKKWSAQQRDDIVGEVAKKDQALAKEIGAATRARRLRLSGRHYLRISARLAGPVF